MTKIPNFENSRWRTAAILKYILSYISAGNHPISTKFGMQMGEKAHLRTMAAVLANATATTFQYIPACRGQRGPAGRASPQAGAGLRAGARRARIAAAVYVSPELYSLPVSQEFVSLRPPLGGRTRLVIVKGKGAYT